MANCIDCLFVHALDSGKFECRRNAPHVTHSIQRTRYACSGVSDERGYIVTTTSFPRVDAFDFCGEFQRAPQAL